MVFIIRKFDPEKHHRRSCRIPGYDFSQPGSYFVTIKTFNNNKLFGHISDKFMILNNYGKIVYDEWIKTQSIRQNVHLGEFIIMPDHIHGILIIQDDDVHKISQFNTITIKNDNDRVTLRRDPIYDGRDPIYDEFNNTKNWLNNIVPCNMIYNREQLYSFRHEPVISKFIHHIPEKSEKFGRPTPGTIPTIIRGFKSSVTRQFNEISQQYGNIVWQRNYYLRIIESENEFHRTSNYIRTNPHNSYHKVKKS
jgi:REP element-mobilizing transposase RayT